MRRKLFGTDGMRGPVNRYPMLPDMALRIGMAAGTYFRSGEKRHRVVIGKDTRLSGYIYENALTAGLCATGVDVFLVGPLPTPAIAFLTRNMRADFGIVISASHNPFYDNGIKFFDAGGFKLQDHVEDTIAALALDPACAWEYPEPKAVGRAYKINDAPGRYIVSIKNSFPANLTLEGMRIVLDCAHGANYKVAPMALEELGAEVIKLGTEPNGLNINHQCGSQFPELAAAKVKETRADIGLALDGDADRLIVIDEKGNILDGDQILGVCAMDLLKKNKLKNKLLVGTVMSNMGLDVFMRQQGGDFFRADVGDRYVAEAMRARDAVLGGEKSGHIIFMEYGTTGDGLLAGLQILRIMQETGQTISMLADNLVLYPQCLINIDVLEKKPFEEIPAIQQCLLETQEELKETGRVFLRYSGTEGLARVMVEGENASQVHHLAHQLADCVRQELS